MSHQPQDGTPDGDAGTPGEPSGTHPMPQPPASPWQSPSFPRADERQPWQGQGQGQRYDPGTPPAPAGPVNPWERQGGSSGSSNPPPHYGAAPAGMQPPGPQPWGNGHPGQGNGNGAYGGSPFPPGQYQAPPKPGVIPLRPLGLGEILDGAFQACRKNPLATFGIAILLQAVVAVVIVLMLGNLISSFEVLDQVNPSSESVIGAVASFGTFATVSSVVSAVALLLLQGVLVIPIARSVINQRTSFGQAWRLARGRILPLFGFGALALVAGLVLLALLIGVSALAIIGLEQYSALVIIPLVLGAVAFLVWVGIKLVVAPATLMLEGTGPWRSVRRSWVLTRGNWWRTFGIVLLTSVIVSIIASVISVPLTFAVSLFLSFSASPSATTPDVLDSLPILLATQGITALFTAIGYAFQAGVTSLLYVDLRIRREGFDVVLMREHERAGVEGSDIVPGGSGSFGHQPGGYP